MLVALLLGPIVGLHLLIEALRGPVARAHCGYLHETPDADLLCCGGGLDGGVAVDLVDIVLVLPRSRGKK
jgi:hypothetical protein